MKENDTNEITAAIDELKLAANEQMHQLLNQKQQIHSLQSNLDSFMQQYKREQSYFNMLSHWFGGMKWWSKLLINVILIGTATGIGALFQWSIVFAIVSFIACTIVSFLLQNDYKASQKQEHNVKENIKSMERTFSASIENLAILEKQLNAILITLCEKNILMAKEIKLLNTKLLALQKEIDAFGNVVQALDETKNSLLENTTQINTSLQQTNTNLIQYNQLVFNENSFLKKMNSNLDDINDSLLLDRNELTLVRETFNERIDQLTLLANHVQSLLSTVTVHLENHHQLHLKLHRSVEQTLLFRQHTNNTISNNEKMVAIAVITLDNDDRKQIPIHKQVEMVDEEVLKQTQDNEALFLEVSALLGITECSSQTYSVQ